MKPLIGKMFSPAVSSYRRPSGAWPTGTSHVHALITDICWDREGNCYPMPEINTADIQGIEKLFASVVFKMLLDEDMISEDLMYNMNSWKHSGCSTYCGKPVEAEDEESRKTLSEYISRAPFSLERMSFNQDSKSVVYRSELSSNPVLVIEWPR